MMITIMDDCLEENEFGKISGILKDEDTMCSYVEYILKRCGFSYLVNDVIEKIKEKKDRLAHVIICFSLGVLFFDFLSLRANIDKEYSKVFDCKKNEKIVEFVWMILSIFHDLGYWYNIEGEYLDEKTFSTIFNVMPVITLPNQCEVEILSYTDGESLGVKNFNRNNAIQSRYNSSTYYNYFRMRNAALKKNCIYEEKYEHGILGGYEVCKLFLTEQAVQYDLEESTSDYIRYNLILDIAYKILDHNIWKADDKSVETYKKYSLQALIGDNYKKINPDKDPLLFLLCVVDTIEWTKRGIDDKFISRIEVSSEKIVIEYDKSKVNIDWVNSIICLPKWVDIRVEYKDNIIELQKLDYNFDE